MVSETVQKFDNYILPYFRVPDRKSPFVQAKELWGLTRKYRALPTQYMVSSLYRHDPARDVMSFMPSSVLQYFQRGVNDRTVRDLIKDKHYFRKRLEAAGFPVVRELLHIPGNGEIHDADGRVVDERAAQDIIDTHGRPVFVKLAKGSRGKGAFIAQPGEDFRPVFRSDSEILVQPVLDQHPDLAAIKSGVINCIRIDTLLIDGGCVNSAASQKFGQGDKPVDNGGHGGLVVEVELETGRMAPVAKQKARFGHEMFTEHPDTGARFAGMRVPCWDELRDTVCRAAMALPELPTLGWDIGVTPTGPVLIEANWRWHIDNLQYGNRGIGDTPVGRAARHFWRTGEFEG